MIPKRTHELAKALQDRRRQFGLRQKDMAYAAGLTRNNYLTYEHGRIARWNETAEKILNSKVFDDDYLKELGFKTRDELNELIDGPLYF